MRMFAALNTIELPIRDLTCSQDCEGDEAWYEKRFRCSRIASAIDCASDPLAFDADRLDGAFSAGTSDHTASV